MLFNNRAVLLAYPNLSTLSLFTLHIHMTQETCSLFFPLFFWVIFRCLIFCTISFCPLLPHIGKEISRTIKVLDSCHWINLAEKSLLGGQEFTLTDTFFSSSHIFVIKVKKKQLVGLFFLSQNLKYLWWQMLEAL